MSDRLPHGRRSFLSLAGAALLPAVASGSRPPKFHLRQAGRCLEVEPLEGERPVEQLYDYRLPYPAVDGVARFGRTYSSHNRRLTRDSVTITFLYDGPKGLSLVVLHDSLDGDGGGSASFAFVGLPPDGEWVVADDRYAGESNYDRWRRAGPLARVDWTWGDDRTDGGAFRGLAGLDRLLIRPAFNEDATLWGEHYSGRVTDWQLLSGSLSSPDRTSLSMDRPAVLVRGPCPGSRGPRREPPGRGPPGNDEREQREDEREEREKEREKREDEREEEREKREREREERDEKREDDSAPSPLGTLSDRP